MSGSVFASARKRVLESGQSALQSEGGSIYEVFPDGRKQFVKAIEPPIRVASGRKMTLCEVYAVDLRRLGRSR